MKTLIVITPEARYQVECASIYCPKDSPSVIAIGENKEEIAVFHNIRAAWFDKTTTASPIFQSAAPQQGK